MKRLIHISVFIFLLMSTAYAQDKAVNAVRVELKSGPVLECTMLKLDYGKSIVVVVPPQDTMTIPWDDILEMNFIEREVRQQQREQMRRIPRRRDVPFRNEGKVSFFEMGTPLGTGYWAPAMGIKMDYGLGHAFSHNHQVYGTIGVRVSGAPWMGLVPVGVEYRGRLKPQGRSLMYFAKTGLNPGVILTDFTWETNSKFNAGPYGSIGIGWTKKRRNRFSWYSKFAYHVQGYSATYDRRNFGIPSAPLETVEEQGIMHSFDISFGLGFN